MQIINQVEVVHPVHPVQRITLTVNEVAELLGISTATVYSMARKNEIPHSRIRSKIVFHRPTIEAWLLQAL